MKRIFAFFLWLALIAALPAGAQSEAVDVELDAARKQVETIRDGLERQGDDAELQRRRSLALEIQGRADTLAESLAPQLSSVEARLAELGTHDKTVKEAPDIAAQRSQLEKTRAALDAQLKMARLLSVEAAQSAGQLSAQRRQQFQARLGERRASVLAPSFWDEFASDLPRDAPRVAGLAREFAEAARAPHPLVWAGVLLFCVAVLIARFAVGRWILRLTTTRVPPGRLRRSFLALTRTVLGVAAPGLIALALGVGLRWSTTLSEAADDLLIGMVGTVSFGGYFAGLAKALLSTEHPSWRLPPLPDAAAARLSHFPYWLAFMVVVAWVVEHAATTINASLSTAITVNCVVALLLGLTLAAGLARAAGRRGEDTPARSPWFAALAAVLWTLLAVSLLSLLVGYIAFGSFVVKQAVWVLVVLCTAYLASTLVEDGFSTLLGSSEAPEKESGARPGMRDQAAVLLSGLGRLFVLLFAIVLLAAPFGEGPIELLQRLDRLHEGLSVGEINIRPGAVLQALVVLAAGLFCVRILKGWLVERYFPTTELDPGMRASAATLIGYAGVIVAVAMGLTALGIGLERIAWVASALSVGIGFGLQAVVQNFVSGLILLAERPVKVGDWVSLGAGVEGDILRINVRATEIQMGDRSTVIVPNSEFVTKTVRNVTHANPLGLVQLKLPLPLATDADRVRNLMLEAFHAHADVLDTPAPNVLLDGVAGDTLVFNATGFVASPRAAYGVRSAVLFDVLERLRQAGIDLYRPPAMLLAPAAN